MAPNKKKKRQAAAQSSESASNASAANDNTVPPAWLEPLLVQLSKHMRSQARDNGDQQDTGGSASSGPSFRAAQPDDYFASSP